MAAPIAVWLVREAVVKYGPPIAAGIWAWWNKDQIAKDAQTLANAMSNADEKAETQLESGAAATTCVGSCPPPPGTECGALYAKIDELTKELAGRRADMLADRPVSQGGLGMYELFLKDPFATIPDPRGIKPHLGNWAGHRVQILQKQERLKSLMTQYRAKKCSPLPPGAETQASVPPPLKPFIY